MLKVLSLMALLMIACSGKGAEEPKQSYPWDSLPAETRKVFVNDMECPFATNRARDIKTWKVISTEQEPADEETETPAFRLNVVDDRHGGLGMLLYAQNKSGDWKLIYVGDGPNNSFYKDFYWITDHELDSGVPFGKYFCYTGPLDQP